MLGGRDREMWRQCDMGAPMWMHAAHFAALLMEINFGRLGQMEARRVSATPATLSLGILDPGRCNYQFFLFWMNLLHHQHITRGFTGT